MMRKGAHVIVLMGLVLAMGLPCVNAQPLDTELPTLWGGDFGNGAATSDAVGGVFEEGRAAAPIPASAYGIPTAFGADWGDVFFATGYQRLLKSAGRQNDGAVFTGFGFGDAHETIGIEGTIAIYDLVGDTFQERSLGLKLHRRFGEQWAVSVGVENMFIAGGTDGGKSAYSVASFTSNLSLGQLPIQKITATLGVGDGRFNSMENVRQGMNNLSIFGSLGVRLASDFGVFGTWAGQDLNVGISVVPFEQLPLVVTPTLVNATGTAMSGRRIGGSIGIGYTLLR